MTEPGMSGLYLPAGVAGRRDLQEVPGSLALLTLVLALRPVSPNAFSGWYKALSLRAAQAVGRMPRTLPYLQEQYPLGVGMPDGRGR